MKRHRVCTWGAIAVTVGALLYLSFSCCCYGHPPAPPLTPIATSPEEAIALRERLMAIENHQDSFRVTIGETELTSYLVYLMQLGAGEFPARDVCVRFSRTQGDPAGYIEVWITFTEVAPADVPTYVRATAKAADGQVVLHITQANAGPCAIPGMMREAIAQVLSESLADLDLGVAVENIEILPGRMVISGHVTGHIPNPP